MTIDGRAICQNALCRERLGGRSVGRFCCRGCFEQYHRHRCLVCDGEMRQGLVGRVRLICGRSECRRAYLADRRFFNPFSRIKNAPATPMALEVKNASTGLPRPLAAPSIGDRGSFDRLWGGDGVLSDWEPIRRVWGGVPDIPDFLRRV